MYVWHEVRNACPLDQSPSYSLGSAGGGGRPVRVGRVAVMSIRGFLGGVGGGCCSCIIFSNFKNLLSSMSNCLAFLVSELAFHCCEVGFLGVGGMLLCRIHS